MQIAGIVLAGGRARRLGGDKPLLRLGSAPLLAHALRRAAPQVAALAISANGDPARFQAFGRPVLADSVPGFVGPLAGILAGMDWAAAAGYAMLASFACDAPFFPLDLVSRLAAARDAGHAQIAVAMSADRVHPVFALWPAALRDRLRHALLFEGARKVDAWIAQYACVTVAFAAAPFDPFFNINTPDDLAKAERLLASGSSANIGGMSGPGEP